MSKDNSKNDIEIDIDKEIDSVLNSSTKGVSTSQDQIFDENESPMARLLKENPIKVPMEGDKIKGKVIEIEKNGVYVELGDLGTGVVYGREVKDGLITRKKLQVGDEITASIVEFENDEGYVELSVREAALDEAWEDLISKKNSREVVATKIIDANKGGLMLEVNGIGGFMPVSQLTAEHYPRVEDGDKSKILEILKSYIGQEMNVCVIDASKEEEKLIVSEKEAYRDKEKKAVAELKIGDVIEGDVSGVVDFGAFVKFLPPSKKDSTSEEDKLEGLVHISQLDWQLIDNPRDVVKVGDRIMAKIISIDDTRISLSIRELKNDPWSNVAKKYKIGDIMDGVVHKINHFGAFVYLDQDIHGLAHVSEFLSGYPRKNIDDIVKIGKKYSWQIMSLEPKEHRMGLKLVKDKQIIEARKKEEESRLKTTKKAANDETEAKKDREKKEITKKEKAEKEEVEKEKEKAEKPRKKKEKAAKPETKKAAAKPEKKKSLAKTAKA